MIFAIATTTLNKEVKRKLKTGQYSREEATFIYMEYLKLKKQRESGTKVAGISMAVIWGLMLVLPLLSGEGLVLPLSVHFLLLLLLAGIDFQDLLKIFFCHLQHESILSNPGVIH